MHLAMHLSFGISTKPFLTLAPRAYGTYHQARGLSGHTSPCGEHACFSILWDFPESKVGTLHQGRKLFSQEHHAFFEQLASSTIGLEVGRNIVASAWVILLLIEDVKFHWSKKLKTACYITIHGARGLAVGV